MSASHPDSFKTLDTINHQGKALRFASLKKLEAAKGSLERLPYSLKILLENLLRQEDGVTVTQKEIEAVINWEAKAKPTDEIQFMPARILLQDFTGVPVVADLAAMRDAIKKLGGDPKKINPLQPADMVIDHSVQVDHFGSKDSIQKNTEIEFQRNQERYQFLKWGQKSFDNFRVVPPSTGIVHQVNLEYLATLAMRGEKQGETWVYPDTLVGTDSHTTMINGLGVVGWGVGGIEAEAAMLGQPVSMLVPQVVGFKLTGSMKPGMNATDLVLMVVQMLRKKGVVGKFVEFYGPGLAELTLADRATIANMAPEYGATIGVFPVDEKTVDYMKLTSRSAEQIELVTNYFKEQNLWYDPNTPDPEYSDTLELDLSSVEPSLAGPSRPQDRVALSQMAPQFSKTLPSLLKDGADASSKAKVEDYELEHGSVVIAAITSCTNTSNPAGLIAAGLLAKNAIAKGLEVKPWVKTSLAPGSRVVTEYLEASELLFALEKLKFNVVGYGCTTCIGNSGPLPDPIVEGIQSGKLTVASVLSGNRNFEGRISPHVRANYLASPALVVAYALAGSVNVNLTTDPIGKASDGSDVFLKDIWPSNEEIANLVQKHVTSEMFGQTYSDVFKGDESWRSLEVTTGELYNWNDSSTYIRKPPFFEGMPKEPAALSDIADAKCLVLLKDSVTTDHISPAGSIQKDSPAGSYLVDKGVEPKDFNSFGSRRGNHEVMIRGTFGNVRLKNQLAPGTEGGFTTKDGNQTTIFEASTDYQKAGTPLIVIAGKEYGTGSSRDWAAKGTLLLGVKAVIAQSFERIHRSNLIGMGVIPLQFKDGDGYESLGLTGKETFAIRGVESLQTGSELEVVAKGDSGEKTFKVLARVDTPNELEYVKHGGILQYVLRQAL